MKPLEFLLNVDGRLLSKACAESIEWFDSRNPHEAWLACHRSDWMLWLAWGIGIDPKLLISASCDCLETEEQPADIVRNHIPWPLIEAALLERGVELGD